MSSTGHNSPQKSIHTWLGGGGSDLAGYLGDNSFRVAHIHQLAFLSPWHTSASRSEQLTHTWPYQSCTCEQSQAQADHRGSGL